ncbi:aldehyde dehydrogenase family protein [Lacunimicrobium album]
MTTLSEAHIRAVVENVLKELKGNSITSAPVAFKPAPAVKSGDWGVFSCVDQAIDAAGEAYKKFSDAPLSARMQAVSIIKSICDSQAEELGRLEYQETKIGRLEHKIEKLKVMQRVPGVEWLKPDAYSGDTGLTIIEQAPFGVIGVITPVTHSLPTLASNAITMLAGGNTLVVNPHPGGAKVACEGVRRFNQAIYKASKLENLITIVNKPTLESAGAIFKSKGVKMLCVTGGPAVARAAMESRKKAVVAGPGNPPVVVDETADLDNAARSIIAGASYDNNLLCIGEKQVFVVAKVYSDFLAAMSRQGAYRLTPAQVDSLTRAAFPISKETNEPQLNRDLVGKDASVLADLIGLKVTSQTPLLFGEADVKNAFVDHEQMMPFLPIVKANDFAHALDMAIESEHSYRHTSVIHSRDVNRMTEMGRAMETTLFVKNGPSMAGIGIGGEGYVSFSIATPTGEGVTTPSTFTRQRRCTLSGALRVI